MRVYYLPVVLLLAAVAVLAVDLPVAKLFLAGGAKELIPGDIYKVLMFPEVFAHGVGIAYLLIAIAVLCKNGRASMGHLLACSFGSGLAANVIKLTIVRRRPDAFELPATVWETFGMWAPLAMVDNVREAMSTELQSFPSAHTATAVGFAVVLCRLYPHGRWLFVALACGAGLQRIVKGLHYPSDVLVGAAVGWTFAHVLLHYWPLRQQSSDPVILPIGGRTASANTAGDSVYAGRRAA